MYLLASQLKELPIISLQSGEPVAWTRQPILDAATLEMVAFHCHTVQATSPLILMTRDIRQLASDCIIVDSEDDLTDPTDLVRFQPLMEANYTPLDKPVSTESGRKLGRVEDYTVNLDTSRLQKLHVRQSLFHAWIGANLIIDRSQIIDVSPQHIIVREATEKLTSLPEAYPEINP